MQSYNLATKTGLAEIQELKSEKGHIDYDDVTQFMRRGQTNLNVSGRPAFFQGDDFYVVDENNVAFSSGYNEENVKDRFNESKKAKKQKDSDYFEVVFVPNNKQQAFLAVVNGDENSSLVFVDELQYNKKMSHVTISYECLRRFYGESNMYSVISSVGNGEIEVVDYKPDSRIELTADERRVLNNWNRSNKKKPLSLVPPQSGYTLVGDSWHRSATVLFYDTREDFSILIGQDEGTYFGVQLADNPKTVESAYKSLMPKEVRNVVGVSRQGEWFAVPCDEENVPAVKDCLLEANLSSCANNGFLALGRDSEDSAYHSVVSDDIRVGRDGTIYAHYPNLHHSKGDHQMLSAIGWVTFHRNTAVRAFSVEGVD